MKLFYMPGACSLAPHIVARELGTGLTLAKVGRDKSVDGVEGAYLKLNPKGYVPALQLDNGDVLTEGPVISQYLADQKPEAGLAPKNGTLERYRLQEMLGYINSEIHKTYSPLFNKATPEESRTERKEYLRKRYKLLDERLKGRDYLFGDRFTVADAYLFTVTNWAHAVTLDLTEFPNIAAFQQRVAARPAVQAAMKEEGLLK
jgi:glutathione S-transferase